MKHLSLILALLALTLAHSALAGVSFQPADSALLKFAAAEIERAAKDAQQAVPDVFISVTAGATQSYRIERDGAKLRVIGGDATGAMYGGLDIAEAIRTGTLDSLKDSDHKPHIEKRGIKFNIPLDLRTPSYSDNSTSAQALLGRYFAAKIRSAIDLAEFNTSADSAAQTSALKHAENALAHWKQYATIYDRQYTPQLLNRVGTADMPALTSKAAEDIEIIGTWKPGTRPVTNGKK